MIGNPYPFEMLHPACGKPALRAAVRPEPGMKLFDSGLARLAGTPYQLGHRLMCGTCGQALQITDFAPDNFFERKTDAQRLAEADALLGVALSSLLRRRRLF